MTDGGQAIKPFNTLSQGAQKKAPIFKPTPFRLAMQHDLSLPHPELTHYIEKQFEPGASLMYSQTVLAYLSAIAGTPANTGKLFNGLHSIWNRYGILPVDDLTEKLLKRVHPDLPTDAIDILHQQIKSRYRDPDPLTGYDRKEHAPLTIGLKHLYAVMTERPVTLVQMDSSGVGALTEHVDKLMANRDGREAGQTHEGSEAYQFADKILRVMAGVIRGSTEEGIRQTRHMSASDAHRTGGDEQTLSTAGIEGDEMKEIIRVHTLPAVERLMAKLSLLGHQNPKDRTNRLRSGTGSAMAIMVLDRHTKPGIDLNEADNRISQEKIEIGMDRHGRLSVEYLRSLRNDTPPADFQAKLLQDKVLDPADPAFAQPLPAADLANLHQLESANDRVHKAMARRDYRRRLGREAGTAHPRAPEPLDYVRAEDAKNYADVKWQDLSRFAPYDHITPQQAGEILEAMNAVLNDPEYAVYLKRTERSRLVPRGEDRPNLLYTTPSELETIRFDYNASARRVQLTPEQHALCYEVLGSFSPTDHSTHTFMKDVVPWLMGTFARDTDHMKEYVRETPGALGTIKAEELTSYAMAASLMGLAGINKLLGSDNANIILRHFTDHIVHGGLSVGGIPPEYTESGHEGGGNIMTVVRPLVTRQRSLHVVDEGTITNAEMAMHRRMDEWKKQDIAGFLRDHGGSVPDSLKPGMTFADIIDPKRNRPGIDLATVIMPLATQDEEGKPLNGEKLAKMLRTRREDKISHLRGENTQHRQPRKPMP